MFQTAKNLRLLRRQMFGREHRVGHFRRVELNLVHPAADGECALGAQIAPVEMWRTVTARDRLDQCLFRKMTLTKDDINEPHD